MLLSLKNSDCFSKLATHAHPRKYPHLVSAGIKSSNPHLATGLTPFQTGNLVRAQCASNKSHSIWAPVSPNRPDHFTPSKRTGLTWQPSLLSINLWTCWTSWQHLPPHASPLKTLSNLATCAPHRNRSTSHPSPTLRRDPLRCAAVQIHSPPPLRTTPPWQLCPACKPPCNLATAAGAALCGEISWEGQTLLPPPHPSSPLHTAALFSLCSYTRSVTCLLKLLRFVRSCFSSSTPTFRIALMCFCLRTARCSSSSSASDGIGKWRRRRRRNTCANNVFLVTFYRKRGVRFVTLVIDLSVDLGGLHRRQSPSRCYKRRAVVCTDSLKEWTWIDEHKSMPERRVIHYVSS